MSAVIARGLTPWGAPFRAAYRDPFEQFDALVRRAFPAAETGFTPAADLAREGDDAVVRLELPGVDVAQDVTVEVDGDRLVVHGERRDEHGERRDEHGEGGDDGSGPWRREVRYGAFRRTFRLPSHVDAGAVSASYDAGVLTVRVTGAYTTAEPQRIAVTGPATGDAAEHTGSDAQS